jgi:hypothetical protein
MGTRSSSFPGVKRPGREADHSHPCSAEVKEWMELYLYSPNTPSWRGPRSCWGTGGIAPSILDLGTRWKWVVRFTPRPLYPQGKSPWYPLDRRLSELESRSGRGGEEKNSQPPPGIEPQNPNHPVRSPTLFHWAIEREICLKKASCI